jgi:hypothetical protein
MSRSTPLPFRSYRNQRLWRIAQGVNDLTCHKFDGVKGRGTYREAAARQLSDTARAEADVRPDSTMSDAE